MMKKMLALMLSGAMVLGMGATVMAEEPAADHVKLGVQMYNMVVGGDWGAIDSMEGVTELITALADAGYEGLEWCNFQLGADWLDLAQVKETMDELGLVTCGMHYHYNADDPEGSAKEVVERCQTLGCDKLIFAFSTPETFGDAPDENGNYTPEQVDKWAENVNSVLQILKDAAAGTGIQVLYHNHATELLTGTEGKYAIDMFDAAEGKEIDVYWASKGLGGSVDAALDYVEANADDIYFLHVKDGLDGSSHTGEMCGWGKGTFDLQGIIDTAKAHKNIEWVIVEDDNPSSFGLNGLDDSVASAEYALANLDFSYAE